jgi:Icc-related predicted phosphoesterase
MQITAISDTHNKHRYIDTRAFDDTDILIHAGDFTGAGTLNQAVDFLQWFNDIDVPHKVLIAGNHDHASTIYTFSDILLKHAPTVTYLCNSSTTINGLNIWGSPYSNEFGTWSWMLPEKELADIWDTIPQNTNIVVTHGPSYGYNDKVNNNFYERDPHVGSPSLTKELASLPKLKAHICGHIHEGFGTTIGEYVSVNASILDESYVPINKPISFMVNKGR